MTIAGGSADAAGYLMIVICRYLSIHNAGGSADAAGYLMIVTFRYTSRIETSPYLSLLTVTSALSTCLPPGRFSSLLSVAYRCCLQVRRSIAAAAAEGGGNEEEYEELARTVTLRAVNARQSLNPEP